MTLPTPDEKDTPNSKHSKPITVVSTWQGKKLDEYSKAELIEIVCELGQSLQQESFEHSRQLDVLSDLVATDGDVQ